MENFYSDFIGAVANITEEDRDRNLWTLEKTPTSLNLGDWTPSVPAVDQVAKIRDILSLHPLGMSPESTKLAKDAFTTLKA